eukprot:1154957-Pelagomonas_calceolata.AAC.2
MSCLDPPPLMSLLLAPAARASAGGITQQSTCQCINTYRSKCTLLAPAAKPAGGDTQQSTCHCIFVQKEIYFACTCGGTCLTAGGGTQQGLCQYISSMRGKSSHVSTAAVQAVPRARHNAMPRQLLCRKYELKTMAPRGSIPIVRILSCAW